MDRKLRRLLLLVAATISLRLTFFLPNSDYKSGTLTTLQKRQTFVQNIALRADSDGFILLIMADMAFADMAVNLHQVSLVPHNITNYLFVGVSTETCRFLAQHSINDCYHFTDDEDANRASSWGEKDYLRKLTIRIDMILEAIGANFTAINMDVDISLFTNPLDDIKVGLILYYTVI